jgi:DNA-directed RNA polymerase subunit RPC12/RpoP
MATRLKKMKINEVSLVTRPAIAREFLLYKSEDGALEVPVVEEVVKTEEPVVEAPVEVPAEPIVEPAIDCQKEAEPVPEPEVAKEVKCPTCGGEIDEEEAKKGESCKACGDKKVKKEAEDLIVKQVEDISKALEQEKLEKAAVMAELAELKKEAFIEKEAKITKEFITKAATELKNIPTLVPDTFGPVLKAASYKLEKSEFDALYGALQAASVFIQKNAMLTKELGVGGEDLSADPAQQLDAIAKSYVSKDAKITYAKAYEMACMNNPAVYAQHVRQARRD